MHKQARLDMSLHIMAVHVAPTVVCVVHEVVAVSCACTPLLHHQLVRFGFGRVKCPACMDASATACHSTHLYTMCVCRCLCTLASTGSDTLHAQHYMS